VGKIFEALQHAQSERQQREKLDQQQLDPLKQNVRPEKPEKPDLLPPDIMKQTPCDCLQHGYRIPRRGTRDLLYSFAGLYPWRCAECSRLFHQRQR
jgi:hypothetical protein